MRLLREKRLAGVHPDLVRVMERAAVIAPFDLIVLEGVRSLALQKKHVASGAARTMKSRHLVQPDGYGHAVDLAPVVDTDGDGDVEPSWHWPHYDVLAGVVKLAAEQVGVPVEWGGDWKSFRDGPHWQLPAGYV